MAEGDEDGAKKNKTRAEVARDWHEIESKNTDAIRKHLQALGNSGGTNITTAYASMLTAQANREVAVSVLASVADLIETLDKSTTRVQRSADALTEQVKAFTEQSEEASRQASTHNRVLMLLTFALVIIGAVQAWATWYTSRQEQLPAQVVVVPPAQRTVVIAPPASAPAPPQTAR